jgi:NADPH:quinone reductase-like Zn-dependent oxidoreductase
MTPTTMRAVFLRAAGGPEQLVCEQVATPRSGAGQALVRVYAAALTRDELEWPGFRRFPRTS